MFVRVKRCKNKNGSVREYLLLCTAKREGKKVKQITLANLGRLDSSSTQRSIDTIIDNLVKFSKKRAIIDASKGLFAEYAKVYGPVVVFKSLWEKTGLKRIMERFAKESNCEFDLVSTIFALVLNRLIDPMSKLSTYDWIKKEIYLHGVEQDIELHHLYRSLDFLERKAKKIEDTLYYQDLNLFNAHVDLVFFDTTSIKFYGEENELMQRGLSKDKRGDLNQVIVGIVMRRDGKPISHHIFSGNTVDVKAFKAVILDLKERFGLKRVIFVGDRGMVSKENIDLLEQEGLEYILGVKLRSLKEVREEVLTRAGRYQKIKDNLFIKEIKLNQKRYIICFNPYEAEKDGLDREMLLEKLKQLVKEAPKGLIKNRGYKRYLTVERGGIKINLKKVEAEKKYDGKYVITSNTELKAEEIALAYRELWKIERVFRELKSYFEIQPIYHYVPRRIKAHIFLCFLALLLEWEFTKRLKEMEPEISPHQVIKDLLTVRVVKLRCNDKYYLVRTELNGKAYLGFRAAGIAVPPRVLEIGKNVVGTSEITGEKCPNIGKF